MVTTDAQQVKPGEPTVKYNWRRHGHDRCSTSEVWIANSEVQLQETWSRPMLNKLKSGQPTVKYNWRRHGHDQCSTSEVWIANSEVQLEETWSRPMLNK